VNVPLSAVVKTGRVVPVVTFYHKAEGLWH